MSPVFLADSARWMLQDPIKMLFIQAWDVTELALILLKVHSLFPMYTLNFVWVVRDLMLLIAVSIISVESNVFDLRK